MTQTPSDPTPEPTAQDHRTFFGHPWGLANLFGVEMWERFSYYGMQAILIYYLYFQTTQGGLGMPIAVATSIMGAYGGSVYIFSVGGAWIADRILGSERTLYYSAILIMFGHLFLAFIPGYPGLIAGLVSIAVGSGGLKTTAGSVLGTLYTPEDNRRDAGFSIFYMGINIGAFLGPLITGLLSERWGFHVGFGAAAIGMAIGLIQYTLGRKNSQTPESEEVSNPLPKEGALRTLFFALLGIAAFACLFIFDVIPLDELARTIAILAAVAAVTIWLTMYRSQLLTTVERNRIVGFIPMFLGNIIFFTIYQQIFTVIAIYSEKRLNRSLFGLEIPPSWVQAIPAFFVIILAGLMASLWLKMGDKQPSSSKKLAIGQAVLGMGLVPLLLSAGTAPNARTPLIVIAAVMLLFTIAELCISPIGLSLTTKVAPHAFRNRMMSMYFMSTAIGTALAGSLAQYYSPDSPSTETRYFTAMIILALVGSLSAFVISPWVNRKFAPIR